MASKNMTTIMALYLTFNLVFLGFTSAQPAVCPISQDLTACVNALAVIPVNPNLQDAQACCNILGGLADPVATVCACNVLKVSLLGIPISERVNQLLNLCPNFTPPPGFGCN